MQKENTSQNHKTFTSMSVGILLLSLLTMAGIVSPALPAIAKDYPNVPESIIEQVSAIPSFAMAIFIIISSWIVRKVGTKKTVELGLWLVIISTVLSLLASNIWILLLSRFLLGAGIGTYNSLAVSLITISYSGKEQSNLLGWENAFQGIGALVGSLLVSLLLLLNWRATFAIYLVSILILLDYHRFVPDIPLSGFKENQSNNVVKKTDFWVVTGSAIATFILMTSYMISIIKMPSYLIENKVGTAVASGLLIGLISLAIIIAGVIYNKVFEKFHYNTLSISVALMAVAYLLLALIPNMIVASIACFVIGISFGFFVPYCFGTAANATSTANSDNVTKIMMISNNLANFLAPFAASMLVLGGTSTINIFKHGGYVLLLLFIIVVLINFLPASHKQTVNN